MGKDTLSNASNDTSNSVGDKGNAIVTQSKDIVTDKRQDVNIFFYGLLDNASGLGVANRAWVKGLRDRGYNVLEADMTGRYGFLYPLATTDVVVNATSPDHWIYTDNNHYLRIGLLVWEYSDLPYAWQQKLSSVDAIGAGNHAIHELLHSISSTQKIQQDILYTPDVSILWQNSNQQSFSTDNITFLVVADLVERKNLELVVEAYIKAFSAKDKVKLIIKASVQNRWSSSPVALLAMIERYRVLYHKKGRPLIEVIDKYLPVKEFTDLLHSCDVYLGLGCEGMDLPLYNAMSLGKLAIVSNYMGHRDFATQDNCILVDASQHKYSALGTLFNYYKIPQWLHAFYPSVEDVSEAMRNAYDRAQAMTDDERTRIGDSVRKLDLHSVRIENTDQWIQSHLSSFHKDYNTMPALVVNALHCSLYDIKRVGELRWKQLQSMGDVFIVTNQKIIKDYFLQYQSMRVVLLQKQTTYAISDALKSVKSYLQKYRWAVLVSAFDVSWEWIKHLPLSDEYLAIFAPVRYQQLDGRDCSVSGIPLRSVEMRAFQSSIVFDHLFGTIVANVYHPVMNKLIRSDKRSVLFDGIIVNDIWDRLSMREKRMLVQEVNTFVAVA